MVPISLVEKIYKSSDPSSLENYLRGRGLVPFPGSVYSSIRYKDRIYKGLFVITDTIVEVRDEISSSWSKLYVDVDRINIYGKPYLWDDNIENIIITESVIDAESVNQSIGNALSGVKAVSLHRASFSVTQFHFLMWFAIKHRKNFIIAFDNDTAGVRNTDKFINKSKYEYGVRVGTMNFKGKDLNDFLVKYGKRELIRRIKWAI